MEGDAKRFEVDINIGTSPCSMTGCPIVCIYYTNTYCPGGQMQCKKHKGRVGGAIFCSEHRPHEAHSKIKCTSELADEKEPYGSRFM